MNYIESVEIKGFWGNKRVFLEFKDDLNFLIGPNGSGKTTIINLIAATLKADFPALYSAQFDQIKICMKSIGSSRKPQILVEKVVDEDMGSFEIRYTIRAKARDKGQTYGVEGPFDDRLYRDPRYRRHSRFREEGVHLGKIISELVEVNWLSIHRTSVESGRRGHQEEGFESTIDQKLKEISLAFSNYFSLLNSKADIETKSFQEYVFLSLLDQTHSGEAVYRQATLEPENKETVVGVLKELGVDIKKASKSVDAHYVRLAQAKSRASAAEQPRFRFSDAMTLSDAHRMGQMTNKWRELQEKRASIFKPRIQFEAIINNLFAGKELHFDPRNAPKVHLQSGEAVDIPVLSSGEKQLFILLGEALLQEERPVVFISDEPELSLHVNWQSTLFGNVRKLNSACQIISATHSPDIVGAFQDRVIKVENCISDV